MFVYFCKNVKVGKRIPDGLKVPLQVFHIKFANEKAVILEEALDHGSSLSDKVVSLARLETRLELYVGGCHQMVDEAPFYIRFAVHDDRSKVFVGIEDNVVRVIAK